MKKSTGVSVLPALAVLTMMSFASAEDSTAVRDLIERVLPGKAGLFGVEMLPIEAGREVFEIESVGDKVVLRGTSGVAVASALHWYLRHYCDANISWRGQQVSLPDPLPVVSPKARQETPFEWRYCFNYCCFSYSMAWWDWPEWERVIDWMALNGINMPLSVTGQESVWREVGKTFGLSDEEMNRFFVGAAYLPFGWMGCMDGWGGPLTDDWINRHAALGRRILERQRALGMKPVLQGFTGHVPDALQAKFPDATFQPLPSWCGFPGTTFIDPNDPLFVTFGKAFIEEQNRQFGTNHFYAADTFIEMSPPSDAPEFLDAMGKAVFEGMRSGDSDAIWIMQGWLFHNNPGFWQPPQTKALLSSVADDRMIVLDLYCESNPVWTITESFHGKPWIWCIIQDFGDVVSMHGGLPQINHGLTSALTDPSRGQLCGAGFIMEGMGYNPVLQELVSEIFWSPEEKDLDAWITDYARQRYGKQLSETERAWKALLETVYQCAGRGDSVVCIRPALLPKEQWGGSTRPYTIAALAEAWQALASCAAELGAVDTYQYDLVNVARQVLSELARPYLGRVLAAYESNTMEQFAEATAAYLELLDDMDALLATREEFLLGKWIENAKRWGNTDEEKKLLEWNARNQITLWGPEDSVLHDYAQKQWSGLIRGFYRPRWEMFFAALRASMEQEAAFDPKTFEEQLRNWEGQWTRGTEPYGALPDGDAAATASRLWEKYQASNGLTVW